MKDIDTIIDEYRNYAIMHWNASKEGDYKTANKNYSKLTKIYKTFVVNQELRETALLKLLNDESYAVQTWAASHCLGLGEFKDSAIKCLEYISRLNSTEAPSFEAKMTLQVWKEKGSLSF